MGQRETGRQGGGWKGLPALVAVLFALVAFPSIADAQSFSPPGGLVFLTLKQGRLTLSGYFTQWENPFTVTVSTVSPALGFVPVSRTIRVFADTPASPLIEGKYELNPQWSVGFWYNPIRGERLRQTVQVVDVPVSINLNRNTDLMDLHVIYTGKRGLTAQLGYYRENGTVSDRSPTPVPSRDYLLQSWNTWVTQGFRGQVRGVRIAPFFSAGYHAASDLRRPMSVLTGIAVAFNDTTSLSSSIWWFDLSDRDPGTATRITVGLIHLFE